MDKSLADLRQEYTQSGLTETNAFPNPFEQFQYWFNQAVAAQLPEPNAMTLATVAPNGQPSARIVLLKGFDETGFVFYTNYSSHKGQQLETSAAAALVFWWANLERQVRIEGQVAKVSEIESDEYFHSRPLGSQLGAWASAQSQVIAGREVLEMTLRALEVEYQGKIISRPPHWGGYRLKPTSIEFWQGRPNRLHDRLLYTPLADGSWKIERLSP
ncbi:pyridoxamine 5'-phosphate oxidase [Merismopedia glauca]|uniref:Pyridoxine/pyridoxamine 5'-phosphate oxidase n=1 Tax=Merismopedia glauca CCAP 1448/3 TaxID=1296344 RepID=A0A2T1BXJ3_9CYAN|nr:pyridoxamine 5'-phosphate oxidase [Merismopedia glauca]PSB00712.1 pyridoxamine 5'-phosphate oxidase [Merismopedia glauca CCAP 1448/3]